MSDNIPFETQSEIIKRLPVKSLLRFRSVSKSWKCFIDSPKLASSYGIHHTKSHRLITRYLDAVGSKENYVSVVDDDTFPQQKFAHTVPALAKLLQKLKVIGCSRGLLCMHGHFGYDSGMNNMVILWNMSIRKSIGIEVPGFVDFPTEVVFGFGVCPVTNDPMIVKITYASYQRGWLGESMVSTCWQVHVFTLSSGSWKSLSKNLPSGTMAISWHKHVVIDRFIYWYAYDHDPTLQTEQLKNFIMSFNMTSKEFEVVDIPESIAQSFILLIGLSKLRESLALFEQKSINEKLVCEVWMMEDVVTKSFTKYFTINADHDFDRNLTGFRKNGEFIFIADVDINRERLVSYEPSSKLSTDLLLYGGNHSFFVSSYVETLLLLDQADCSILETFN